MRTSIAAWALRAKRDKTAKLKTPMMAFDDELWRRDRPTLRLAAEGAVPDPNSWLSVDPNATARS